MTQPITKKDFQETERRLKTYIWSTATTMGGILFASLSLVIVFTK